MWSGSKRAQFSSQESFCSVVPLLASLVTTDRSLAGGQVPPAMLLSRVRAVLPFVALLQALRALLSVNRPRTFEGMVVDITYPCHTTYSCGHEPLGPCPVLLLMERLTRDHGYRTACSSHWEAKAVAVMAQLIEAGFKPSMYPGEGPWL